MTLLIIKYIDELNAVYVTVVIFRYLANKCIYKAGIELINIGLLAKLTLELIA